MDLGFTTDHINSVQILHDVTQDALQRLGDETR